MDHSPCSSLPRKHLNLVVRMDVMPAFEGRYKAFILISNLAVMTCHYRLFLVDSVSIAVGRCSASVLRS